jgi:hypothetical protein
MIPCSIRLNESSQAGLAVCGSGLALPSDRLETTTLPSLLKQTNAHFIAITASLCNTVQLN